MSMLPMNANIYGQPNDAGVQMQDISSQRKLAEQLRQQGAQELQGQMVSGRYVAPSWTQQLAKVLQSGLGGYYERDAQDKEKAYGTQKNKAFADILAGNKPQQVAGAPVTNTSMPAYEPSQQDQFGSPLPNVERTPVTTTTTPMTQETPEQQMARVQPQVLDYMQQYGNTPEGQYLLNQLGKQDDRAYAHGEKVDDRQYADTREDKLYTRNRGDQVTDREDVQEFQRIQAKEAQGFQLNMQEKQFSQQFKMQAQSQGFAASQQSRSQAFQAGQNAMSRAQQEKMAGSNVAPVAVLGPDGQPMYVNRNDAIGKQPYNANATAQGSPAQRLNDSKDVLQILKQAAPMINKSTGSGMGSLVDSGAAFFGGTTSGAQNAASLKALEGSLISKMPKMSGPQSDKDVLLYKQMAGQIGDPTLPPKQKQAAMDTINQLNSRYAGVPYEPLNYGSTQTTSAGKGGVSKSVYDDADAILGGQ